jgi:hypothetical protein
MRHLVITTVASFVVFCATALVALGLYAALPKAGQHAGHAEPPQQVEQVEQMEQAN